MSRSQAATLLFGVLFIFAMAFVANRLAEGAPDQPSASISVYQNGLSAETALNLRAAIEQFSAGASFPIAPFCRPEGLVPEFIDILTSAKEEGGSITSVAIGYRMPAATNSRVVVAFAAQRSAAPPPWAHTERLPNGASFTSAEPPPELPGSPSYYWWDDDGSHRFVTVDGVESLHPQDVRDLLVNSDEECG